MVFVSNYFFYLFKLREFWIIDKLIRVSRNLLAFPRNICTIWDWTFGSPIELYHKTSVIIFLTLYLTTGNQFINDK